MPTVVHENNFDTKNVTFTTPVKKGDKLKSYMLYSGEMMLIETPWLKMPWGPSPPYKDADSTTKPWELSLQEVGRTDYKTIEEIEHQQVLVTNWFESWRKLYDMFIQFGIVNSKIIYGTQYEPSQADVVKVLTKPFVRDSDEYPSRIRTKIYNRDGVPDVHVYQGSTESLSVPSFAKLSELMTRGSFGKFILIPGIWFVGGKMGLSLSVKQALLMESSSQVNVNQFAFKGVTFTGTATTETSAGSKSSFVDETEDKSDDVSDDASDDESDDESDEVGEN